MWRQQQQQLVIFDSFILLYLPSRVVVKGEQWTNLLCTTRRLPRLTACRLFFFLSTHIFLLRTPAALTASLSFIGACCVLRRVYVLLDPKLTHTSPCETSTILLLFYFILLAVACRFVKWEQWIYDTSPATSDFMQAFFFFWARLFAPNSSGARSKFELHRCLLRFASGVRVVGPETHTHARARHQPFIGPLAEHESWDNSGEKSHKHARRRRLEISFCSPHHVKTWQDSKLSDNSDWTNISATHEYSHRSFEPPRRYKPSCRPSHMTVHALSKFEL